MKTRPRVLVIDDEPALRSLLTDIFAIMDVDADTASDGSEGLELLARREYDLVVTDQMMPGMTGLEVIERVKRMHPGTRVALLSGSLMLDDTDRLRAMGLPVFSKPILLQPFQRAIAELLPSRG